MASREAFRPFLCLFIVASPVRVLRAVLGDDFLKRLHAASGLHWCHHAAVTPSCTRNRDAWGNGTLIRIRFFIAPNGVARFFQTTEQETTCRNNHVQEDEKHPQLKRGPQKRRLREIVNDNHEEEDKSEDCPIEMASPL